MNDCFKVVKIDQNGRKIDYKNNVTAYTANTIAREMNRSLKEANPHRIRKYEVGKENEE